MSGLVALSLLACVLAMPAWFVMVRFTRWAWERSVEAEAERRAAIEWHTRELLAQGRPAR
jgi:hypothetical protein